MTQANNREQKGVVIAKTNMIRKIDDHTYKVKSQSGNGEYEVISTELGFICSCPDSMYRNVKCKHVYGLELSLAIKKEVKVRNEILIQPVSTSNCIYCKSDNIVRDGVRHNKHVAIQKFHCKICKKYFTINLGFEKMKHDPKGITTAMQLYFSGESLRNTAKSLRLLGMDVTHQTVYNWIKKYTKLMQEYSEKLKPQVSDTWRADEMYLKIRGNQKYMYAMMDDETRFFIAQEVADTKYTHDVQGLFQEASRIMERKPKTLITDGAYNYQTAYQKEYWTREVKDRPKHIRHIRFNGDNNNNKMERLNGEVRDREKIMRGLKIKNTPLLTGYQVYHNYFRQHQGLQGQTPAEACNIKIGGANKWITFIQNAKNNASL